MEILFITTQLIWFYFKRHSSAKRHRPGESVVAAAPDIGISCAVDARILRNEYDYVGVR
jgi:hypothetical protein